MSQSIKHLSCSGHPKVIWITIRTSPDHFLRFMLKTVIFSKGSKATGRSVLFPINKIQPVISNFLRKRFAGRKMPFHHKRYPVKTLMTCFSVRCVWSRCISIITADIITGLSCYSQPGTRWHNFSFYDKECWDRYRVRGRPVSVCRCGGGGIR